MAAIALYENNRHVGALQTKSEHVDRICALLNHGLGLIEACERHLNECVTVLASERWCYLCGRDAGGRNGFEVHGVDCTVPLLRAKLAEAKGGRS